jgi:hypothetical protein
MDQYRNWFTNTKKALQDDDNEVLKASMQAAVCIWCILFQETNNLCDDE